MNKIHQLLIVKLICAHKLIRPSEIFLIILLKINWFPGHEWKRVLDCFCVDHYYCSDGSWLKGNREKLSLVYACYLISCPLHTPLHTHIHSQGHECRVSESSQEHNFRVNVRYFYQSVQLFSRLWLFATPWTAAR